MNCSECKKGTMVLVDKKGVCLEFVCNTCGQKYMMSLAVLNILEKKTTSDNTKEAN